MPFYTSVSLELEVYFLRFTYVTDKIAPFRGKRFETFQMEKCGKQKEMEEKKGEKI
jgi:hypothetical protein